MPNLAQPTFITGADDTLATVDIYTESNTSTPINSIQDFTASFDKEAIGKFLRGGKAVLKLLPELKKLSKLNFKNMDPRSLLNQVSSVSGTLGNAIKNLPDGQLKTVLSEVSKGSTVITASASGVISKLPYGNLNSTQGILGAVTALAPDVTSSITDNPTITNVISGITNAANSNGVKGILKPILESGELNKQSILKIAKATLPGIIKNADLGSLKAIANNTAPGEVSSLYKSVVSDFSASYTKPFSCTIEDEHAQYTDIVGSFNTIAPNWNKLTLAGITLPSIHSIAGASEDFKSVIEKGAFSSPDGSDEKFNLLATNFDTPSIEENIKKAFPKTIIKELDPVKVVEDSTLNAENINAAIEALKRREVLENKIDTLVKEEKYFHTGIDFDNLPVVATTQNKIDSIKTKITIARKKL